MGRAGKTISTFSLGAVALGTRATARGLGIVLIATVGIVSLVVGVIILATGHLPVVKVGRFSWSWTSWQKHPKD